MLSHLLECVILFPVSDFNLSFTATKGRTSRAMKRYERKWKHICLKRAVHRTVHDNEERKIEQPAKETEKQLVSQK